jgi:signal transduction histidine kinase
LLSITDILVQNYDHSDENERISGIRKIQESMKQIYNLLENLLTWSRSQSGRIQFEPVQFSLSNIVQESYNLHKIPAENKGVIISADIPENVMMYGDREMINTVVRNLVNNAVKFTGPGKRVDITLSEDKNSVSVTLSDQGVGISEEDLRKLFRIDVKFKSKGTSGEKGTGLGLIICKEFVEKNGGEMFVRSVPGEGSEFGFIIPKSEEE